MNRILPRRIASVMFALKNLGSCEVESFLGDNLPNVIQLSAQNGGFESMRGNGEWGSGAGKGGGSGGSVRDAGGSFGKMESAREEEYFRKQAKEQIHKLKSHLQEEIDHHEDQIKKLEKEIKRHKSKITELNKDESSVGK